jgi:ElaB/YqjD/DUF883 family membrane-anchored ribosome-binding protein
MPSTTESVEELREESERSREALAATVSELRGKVGDAATELKTRVSPAHIKQEMKNYARDQQESLVRTVQRNIKDNPLQMAAVGAALAYPAWGLLRAIPTPLLMIGAGLFLTSKRGQQTAKDVKAKLDDAVQQGTEKVSDMAGSIKSDLEDRIAGARYGVEEARDTLTTNAEGVAGKARTAWRSGVNTIHEAAAGAANTVAATAEDVSSAATETAGKLQDRAGGIGRGPNSRKATDFIKENPLLVAGIGAAIGAFIAAALPPSEAENRVFGAGSDALKDKAREAAAKGIERAGDIAAEAAGSATAAAAREGLDAAGVQRALSGIADSVRTVADRGLDTALGGAPQTDPYQNNRNNQNNQRTSS